MPKQSAMSGFYYGQTNGRIQATIILAGIRLHRVQPSAWKKFYGIRGVGKVGSKDAKGTARIFAGNRFPQSRDLFKRVKDDGRAVAVLIALWGAETHGGTAEEDIPGDRGRSALAL